MLGHQRYSGHIGKVLKSDSVQDKKMSKLNLSSQSTPLCGASPCEEDLFEKKRKARERRLSQEVGWRWG